MSDHEIRLVVLFVMSVVLAGLLLALNLRSAASAYGRFVSYVAMWASIGCAAVALIALMVDVL